MTDEHSENESTGSPVEADVLINEILVFGSSAVKESAEARAENPFRLSTQCAQFCESPITTRAPHAADLSAAVVLQGTDGYFCSERKKEVNKNVDFVEDESDTQNTDSAAPTEFSADTEHHQPNVCGLQSKTRNETEPESFLEDPSEEQGVESSEDLNGFEMVSSSESETFTLPGKAIRRTKEIGIALPCDGSAVELVSSFRESD